MKQTLLICGFSAVLAASLLISSPSSAKTVKACEDEWKANKSTIQASGKKKTDFMTECRAETASTEPATAPAAQAAPAASSNPSAAAPRARSAKTIRACAAEWTANKASLEASGKTRKDFITECRAGTETTAAATPSTGMTPRMARAAGKKTVKACDAEWKANKASIQASGKKKTDFMTECRARANFDPSRRSSASTGPHSGAKVRSRGGSSVHHGGATPNQKQPQPQLRTSQPLRSCLVNLQRSLRRKLTAPATRSYGPTPVRGSITTHPAAYTVTPRWAPICARKKPQQRALGRPRERSACRKFCSRSPANRAALSPPLELTLERGSNKHRCYRLFLFPDNGKRLF